MIILPVIPAIVAALTPIVNGALAAATAAAPVIATAAATGALVGGGVGAVTEGVASYHEHGELTGEVLGDAARGAIHGGKDGALMGTLFAPVGLIVGPVIGPALNIIDDIAAPAAKQGASIIHRSAMTVDKAAVNTLKHLKHHAPEPIKKWLPKTKYSTGYVYVLQDAGSGANKIGKSIHPETRLKQIKSPSGAKSEIVCTIPTYNMAATEKALHSAYASQNLPNTGAGQEWFSLSNAQVKAICG